MNLIFIIILVLAFTYVIVNFILDSKAPIQEVDAMLLDKRIDTRINDDNIINDDYILIFRVNDNKKIFAVSYDYYKKYNENDKGILVFKRNRFVDFEVRK